MQGLWVGVYAGLGGEASGEVMELLSVLGPLNHHDCIRWKCLV